MGVSRVLSLQGAPSPQWWASGFLGGAPRVALPRMHRKQGVGLGGERRGLVSEVDGDPLRRPDLPGPLGAHSPASAAHHVTSGTLPNTPSPTASASMRRGRPTSPLPHPQWGGWAPARFCVWCGGWGKRAVRAGLGRAGPWGQWVWAQGLGRESGHRLPQALLRRGSPSDSGDSAGAWPLQERGQDRPPALAAAPCVCVWWGVVNTVPNKPESVRRGGC